MQIAIVDYKVVPSNPAGGCHWRLLRALSKEHSFTVFSVEFDNPDPDRIEWVRIPAPSKPLALLFVMYHLMAPIIFYLYCWRRHKHFDLVQIVESKFSFGDVSYAHFCHRHYLRRFWRTSRPKGARRLSRWLDHKLHAAAEQWVFRRVRRVVVPSTGLLREIEHEYQYTEGRIQVIANPIEIEALERPGDFDRASFRRSMALDEEDQVLIFVALGHFERKGLPALMQAIAQVARPRLKLVVVGGSDPLLDTYKDVAAGLGIEAQVRFAGRRSDVRPYFLGRRCIHFTFHIRDVQPGHLRGSRSGTAVDRGADERNQRHSTGWRERHSNRHRCGVDSSGAGVLSIHERSATAKHGRLRQDNRPRVFGGGIHEVVEVVLPVPRVGIDMDVLVIHNSYRQRGGEDEVFHAEVELLRSRGHRVVTYRVSNDLVELKSRASLAAGTIWSSGSYAAIRKLIRSERPQLAHVHNTLPLISPAAYYAVKREGLPVVQTLHNYRLLCPAGTLFRNGAVCTECVDRKTVRPAVSHRCSVTVPRPAPQLHRCWRSTDC